QDGFQSRTGAGLMKGLLRPFKALIAVGMLSGWGSPIHPDAKGDVEQALLKLSAAENFSWVAMTIEESEGKEPKLTETLEGKSVKDGWCQISRPKTKKSTDAFLKGDRIALLTPEGWRIVDVKDAAP